MRDWAVRRLLITHLVGVVCEWAVTFGLLVHAFRWGGSSAVGVASLTLLLPPLVCAPLVGAALARWRTNTVRFTALAAQAVVYGLAALIAAAGGATPVVAPFVAVGLSLMSAIPPTSAALLPRLARSPDSLVAANLWVTHCDSASALGGSLVAGLVVGWRGPDAVFLLAAVGAGVGAAATSWRPSELVRAARGSTALQPRRVIRRTLAEFRAHPWSRAVLGASSVRNIIVGGFDILLVIVAIEILHFGDGGPGYLGALVGGGALLSTVVTTAMVRRARLLTGLIAAIVAAAALVVVLGLRTDRPVTFVVLPLVGLCMALMDALARTLLQRSTDPRNLGSLFATLGLVTGVGQITGSVIAQVMLAVGDVRLALYVLGGLLTLLAVVGVRSWRRADVRTDVPVSEMALLAGLPMFASLPSAALERVARSTETLNVEPETPIVVERQRVDSCFVIADGEFEVSARGVGVRRASRGETIGEVALLAAITSPASVTAITPGMVVRIGRQPFLLALTGHDVNAGDGLMDFAVARERFRDVVATHQRHASSGAVDRAASWVSLGAAGRLLGDPSYIEVLTRGASLARTARDEVILAEAAAMTTWPGAFFFIAENPDWQVIELCESALEVLADDDPIRVRVLAALASNVTFAASAERRMALITEAHALAERHHDPALTGAVLNAEFVCLWEPGTLERREVIAASLSDIAVQIDDPELRYIGDFFGAYCLAERSRLGAARERLVALRALRPDANNQYFEFLSERLLLSIDIATGHDGLAERIDQLATRHAGTPADTAGTWALQVGGLAYQAGTLDAMVPTISSMLAGPQARTWRAALALAHMIAGDRAAAVAALDEQGSVARNYFWITVTQVQAEVAAGLGVVDRCAALFDELLPFRGHLGITASGSLCFGLVSRSLGELALALGRWGDAVELLDEAIAAADAEAMHFETVIARRLCASARRALGDDESARALADHALATARRHGYGREEQLLLSMS